MDSKKRIIKLAVCYRLTESIIQISNNSLRYCDKFKWIHIWNELAPFTYQINWFKMSGYGKLQNDSDNQDDPDVDQSAQTNEIDDCVSYTSHDSNEESPLIGNIFAMIFQKIILNL